MLSTPHNVLEGNAYQYILAGVDFASRCTVARCPRMKKAIVVEFALEAIYKKGVVFKYSKVLFIS